MESDFLKNLKNAVEKGEFNSEAAKKIIEINKLADEKLRTLTKPNQKIEDSELSKSVEARLQAVGTKTVTEEEATALNSDYEKKMQEIKDKDAENKRIADLTELVDKQISTLLEIEDMVQQSVGDMVLFIEELESKFSKEFQENNPIFVELKNKITQIRTKYVSIINN